MLVYLQKSKIGKFLVYLLLVNFINLTANFYHASVMDSSLLVNHDPIDSLAELVLEFVLDMDEETIPDTEVPHEKKKLSDIKLHFGPEQVDLFPELNFSNTKHSASYAINFDSIKGETHSPPPRSFNHI